MHRTVSITVASSRSDSLCEQLQDLAGVVGLSIQRGASLKPQGDVLTVNALNMAMDDVLVLVEQARLAGPVSLVTSEVASIIDPDQAAKIGNDSDEAIWEKMEANLRHQGRTSFNYLSLMALGGVISAVGLISPPGPQTLYLIAASVIAPGLEPLAAIPLSLAMRNFSIIGRALRSMLLGYGALVGAAALCFTVQRAAGVDVISLLSSSDEAERLAHPDSSAMLVTVAAAFSAMLMISSYRRTVIAGPVVALVVIPAASLIGMAAAAGKSELFIASVGRLLLDFMIIILAGWLVFGFKQSWLHRRRAMA